MTRSDISVGSRSRLVVHCLVLGVLLVGAFLAGPLLQMLTNEAYADTRRVLAVPNFLNVASNLPFLLVGVAGLALCAAAAPPRASASWRVFYAGMVLTCLGSVWYHLAPSDGAIVWDRIGMTVAFVGLLFAVLEESSSVSMGPVVLTAALLFGVASVLWWRWSGDLRMYAWVQLAPLACAATSVVLGWLAAPIRRALESSLILYLLAKLVEMFDGRIYALSHHVVSGHTLKHLLAAAAAAAILAVQWRVATDGQQLPYRLGGAPC